MEMKTNRKVSNVHLYNASNSEMYVLYTLHYRKYLYSHGMKDPEF